MSAAPTPSLFDEGLARRLDTVLTAAGALLLAGIEGAALIEGERVRALFMIEAFGLSLLAFAGLLRFSRAPWLATLSTVLVLVLCVQVSWFRTTLPPQIFPIALGLLSSLFLVHARLPRAVVVALIATALSLAALLALEQGSFSAILLYALIAWSARGQTPPEPTANARHLGDRRWWPVYLAALVLMLVLGTYNQLREPLELFSRPLFEASLVFGTVTTLVWLWAWWMFVGAIHDLRRSAFWSAIRLGVLIQAGLTGIILGLQLYGLAGDHERWPSYVAAGHALTFVTLSRVFPLAILCLLPGSGMGGRRRLTWPWLVVVSEALTLVFRTTVLAIELDRTAPVMVSLSSLLFLFGLVTMWGLMRSIHETLADTSMADAFSSEAPTPETRAV
ncbi:MAG TPA: hypothetical protein PK095_16730 [Myxococcota bacterium]|nr:hypothetical protein [Myxococcota bacterium]